MNNFNFTKPRFLSILGFSEFIMVVCLCLPFQVWSYPYSEIYVFGDSLSDTGRLFEAIGVPPTPYFEGHSSNGNVWVEHLANSLDLSYNPKTNFAWAGATTGTGNVWSETVPDAELSGLQQQVDSYIAETVADPNALYVIWAGSNDFQGDMSNPQETITTAVTNLVSAVGKLRKHGVRHLLVINMPDLGKTPRGLASGNSAAMTGLTIAFNQALAENLQPFNVIQADMPTSLEMVNDSETHLDPNTFSLANFTDACFDKETQTVCDTPSHYFYWDDIHPTTTGHQVIALIVYSAIADPVYMDYTSSDAMAQPILRLPVVEVIGQDSKEFVLDAQMVRDSDKTQFGFVITGTSLQTTKFQGVITFPSDHQYPTFEQSTGVLHLPVVHHVQPEIVVCVTVPCDPVLNFVAKYMADLNFVSETLINPFKAPLFVLTGTARLE